MPKDENEDENADGDEDEEGPDVPDDLLDLRDGGEDVVAFVHPASGLATAFRRMVPAWRGEQTLVAFENLDPADSMTCSVAGVARHYWSRLAPRLAGTLTLVGWSFGGCVAAEMASLALGAGVRVTGLVLLDSAPPALVRARRTSAAESIAGLFEVGLDGDGVSLQDVDAILLAVADRLNSGLSRRREDPSQTPVRIEPADLLPFVETYRWYVRALHAPWSPAPVPVATALVRARDERGWPANAPDDLGWSSVIGHGLDVHRVPGTHYSMVKDGNAAGVAGLVSELAAAPRKAAGNGTGNRNGKGAMTPDVR